MKKYAIVLAMFALAFTLTGCGKSSTPQKYSNLLADKSGKYIKLGFYGAPEQINPIKAPEFTHDQMFVNMIFASPLRKLDNGSYVPYLFEQFETSLDGEQVVLKANWRKGLKWHDGNSFEPSEFDYNLAQMRLPETNSPYSSAANGIVAITNTEDKVEIRFADNSVKYMDMLCAGLLPAHILADEKLATDTTKAKALEEFFKKPIGLGPYKVVDNSNNVYFELQPDTNFFDGKGISRPGIVIACSHELQQSISDFREGMIDWLDIPSFIGEQLQNLGIENVIYTQYPNPAVMAWVFNSKNEKLKDIRIRKALNLIMDRKCATHYFGADSTLLFDNLIPVDGKEKNIENAFAEGVKLLTEAGVVDSDNDGFRDYNGNRFNLKIMVNDDNMTRKMIAEKMIAQLKEAGISAEIESIPWSDFVSEKLKKGNYDTALLSYHIGDDYSMKALFSTRTAEDNENLNFTGISDSELDVDLKALNSIITTEEKAIIAKRVNEKLSLLCPCAFLVRQNSLALIHGDTVTTLKANTSFWNDIFNWKLMFGNESSRL